MTTDEQPFTQAMQRMTDCLKDYLLNKLTELDKHQAGVYLINYDKDHNMAKNELSFCVKAIPALWFDSDDYRIINVWLATSSNKPVVCLQGYNPNTDHFHSVEIGHTWYHHTNDLATICDQFNRALDYPVNQ